MNLYERLIPDLQNIVNTYLDEKPKYNKVIKVLNEIGSTIDPYKTESKNGRFFCCDYVLYDDENESQLVPNHRTFYYHNLYQYF